MIKSLKQVIKDVFLMNLNKFTDERGSFSVVWNYEEIKKSTGIRFKPIQLNQSISDKNVIRGMHYQDYPVAQSKLITVVQGSIIDVVIDIRKRSETFKQMFCTTLSDENNRALFVPQGFAHGFMALEENTIVNYLVDEEFVETHQASIHPFSFENKIWPINKSEAIISKRDLEGLDFKTFQGI